MSGLQDFLMIDLNVKKKLPGELDKYFKLDWMYHDLTGFDKPSPDQIIEEQKASGNRVQIIKKAAKASNQFKAIASLPVLKAKAEVKQSMPIIFKEEDASGAVASVNVAIIGPSQSGKSSVFGWIQSQFVELDFHKLKSQSQKKGLENAFLAWNSLVTKEEQEKGVSVETSYFTGTKEKVFNFFDTPGNEDFISEVISSCFFCDVAVLVADGAVRKNIENKVIIPSKDKMYLARACGINHLIIFISKTDKGKNSQEVLNDLQSKLVNAAKESGFKAENIKTVQGSVIANKLSSDIITLISSFPLPGKADLLKPVRLAIEDKAKLPHGQLLGYWLSGYLLSGILKTGANVVISQSGVSGKVKEIMKAGEKVSKAICGDFIDLTLCKLEGDFEAIARGNILSSSNYEQGLVSKLRIRGITNDPFVPLLKRQSLILHILNFRTQVQVCKILRKVQGKDIKNNPRSLRGRSMGDIEVLLSSPLPVESFKSLVKLSRCLLTYQSSIILGGMVTDLL